MNEQFENILIYFSKSLMGKANEEDILWDLAKNCIAKLGFVDCVVYLLDHDNRLLVQKAAYGPKNPKDQKLYNPVEINIGDGITGYVAQSGQAEIIKDTSKDNRYIEDDALRLSEICVPIVYEDTIYGVIDCEHPQANFFTAHHLKMLSAIASICAIKIKSVRDNLALMEEKDRLLEIKEEMLALKLKTLNSQLNPHFVFNALNSIQYFITSEKKRLALEYLSTFSKLIRFYLKQLERDTVSLKEEIEMLNAFLKLQKLRYDDSFDFGIAISEGSDKVGEAIIPSLVVQTFFENTIEQSMSNQQKNQHFKITFKVFENSVTMEVQHKKQNTGAFSENHPEHRQNILQWQDQIDLLNTLKQYNITHTITESNNEGNYIRNMALKLPNLT
ncbi:GAF domain-containing protein [Flagellimonas alvinocaridis]|uniref:GAF domain-containing protein n=1 Tax=Flagellimonas alvinocaridis TaxID=2530200 RepID=A0A4V4HXI7_9FLAO|nr:histidine kinase [Allomuricauda alvinocaridis]THV61186.1 GAF domain-containing protein [Allomuricauda alvinocaridis]